VSGGGAVAVRPLVKADEGAAAAVLSSSHQDYPAFASVFPDGERRRRALSAFFRATVHDAVKAGVAHGADRGGELLGVGLWLPPGASPLSAPRKLRMLPAMTRVFAAAPASFATFARYGGNVERAHPAEPHWYLVVLGVRHGGQRQGVGTALVEAGLELVDADGAGCYLETSDPANVAFYERFGFRVRDPALPLVPNGPSHVAMWRAPRAVTARPRRTS
jgi:ribosomal protein S18 acetylase RimI-like enzyme